MHFFFKSLINFFCSNKPLHLHNSDVFLYKQLHLKVWFAYNLKNNFYIL